MHERLKLPGLEEPPYLGGEDLVVVVDPGDQTGWLVARMLPNELRVSAIGTGTPEVSLRIVRELAPRTAHMVVEEPAGRGTPHVMALFGRFLEAVHAYAQRGGLDLYIVRPTQWKQYPLRKRQEAERLLTANSGALAVPSTRHERDALGILAWWYLNGGKEDVHGGL